MTSPKDCNGDRYTELGAFAAALISPTLTALLGAGALTPPVLISMVAGGTVLGAAYIVGRSWVKAKRASNVRVD